MTAKRVKNIILRHAAHIDWANSLQTLNITRINSSSRHRPILTLLLNHKLYTTQRPAGREIGLIRSEIPLGDGPQPFPICSIVRVRLLD